jgi:hypothetical protein
MKIRVLHPPPLLLSPWRYRPLLKAVVGAAWQSFSPHHHRPIIEHAKAPISPLVTTLHSRRQKAVNAAKIRAAGAIFPLPLVSSIAPPFPSLFGLLLTFCSFLSAPRPRCRRRWPPMHLHRPRTSPPRAPPPPHRCWRPLVSHVAAYLAWHVPLGPSCPPFPPLLPSPVDEPSGAVPPCEPRARWPHAGCNTSRRSAGPPGPFWSLGQGVSASLWATLEPNTARLI